MAFPFPLWPASRFSIYKSVRGVHETHSPALVTMYITSPTFGAAVLVGLAVLSFLWKRAQSTSSRPLPPGPKPWPLVGNLFDVPSEDRASTFRKLGQKYGMYPSLPVRFVERPLTSFYR